MKKLLPLLFLLLLVSCSNASEKLLFAQIVWDNGEYKISSLSAVMDERTEMSPGGEYLVKILDSKGKTIYQLKTDKPVEINPAPPGYNFQKTIEWYELKKFSGSMMVFIPLPENASTLSFEHDTNILARADLSVLCNKNGKCDFSENYLSCPQDCHLTNLDSYCFAEEDGECDPDCMAGIDPDCGKPEPVPEGFSRQMILTGLFVLIIIILIAILFAEKFNSKKTKNKKQKIT